ncbi:TPA: hypothetical protein DDZ86_00135 [Candidatus Dependentiae bacterium]|nr:MAG: Ankyrin repeat protein [candidate division TM6 bacterium GW2011_GWF2_43_87]HBL98036.1 hypothetical protein [Candidatus Dependentiae bacterium]
MIETELLQRLTTMTNKRIILYLSLYATLAGISIQASNSSHSQQTTSLFNAARNGELKTVKKLIQKNGKINKKKINKKDECERTPLYLACLGGHIEIVETLLKAGALPNKNNSPTLSFVNTLIEKTLGIYEEKPPYYNRSTPLCAACYQSSLEMVKLLTQAHVNANEMECDCNQKPWKAPLHIACATGKKYDLLIVKELINAGANLNIKNHFGNTPLHIAYNGFNNGDSSDQEHFLKIILTLIQAGANPSQKNDLCNIALPLHGQYALTTAIIPFKQNTTNKINCLKMVEPLLFALLQKKSTIKTPKSLIKQYLILIPAFKRAIKQFEGKKIHSRLFITPAMEKLFDKFSLELQATDNQIAKDTRYFYNNMRQHVKLLKKRCTKKQEFTDLKISFNNHSPVILDELS